MTLLYIVSALLFTAAAALLLGLTPERIAEDFSRIITPEPTLRDRARIAQGKKKSHKIALEFQSIQAALKATGKNRQFAFVCAASLLLFVAGAVFSLFIGNLFLAPVLTVFLACAPFFHVKSTLAHYQKHVGDEMETALSIITTSYVRSDNIVSAVSENIAYLKPPVKDIFGGFVAETTAINADIKAALRHLRGRVDNQVYREWCDGLIQCQDDRNLKTSLMPIVNKLTDIRLVNNELQTILSEPKKEYWMMVCLVIGNIPLLYLLNKEWFHSLMDSLPGKIVLAASGVVIAVTAVFMTKYTRPLEYKR